MTRQIASGAPRVVVVARGPLRDIEVAARAMRVQMQRRDAAIVAARTAGETWAAICAASGLSRQAAMDAARRGNGGQLPQPG